MVDFKMKRVFAGVAIAALLIAPAMIGCKGEGDEPAKKDEANTKKDGHDDHAHPSEGPHGGYLIELGNEEYHGELVNSEDHHTVTIYILDGSAKKEVPIAATSVTINATVDGKPTTFELKATGAADGKASQFVSDDVDLVHAFDENEIAKAKLNVTIGDTPYSGDIDYHGNHDHDEHGDHDDHDEHGDHDEHDEHGDHDDHEDDDHDHEDDDHDHKEGHDHEHEDDDHDHEEEHKDAE